MTIDIEGDCSFFRRTDRFPAGNGWPKTWGQEGDSPIFVGRKSGQSPGRKSGQSPARGFTLLEVILASLLMATVLTALLGIFNVYSHLFATGGIQVRHAQLITALERQLTDDLRSAMEDSPRDYPDFRRHGGAVVGENGTVPLAATVTGPSGVVRRYSLLGTAAMLRFDVLQMPPEDLLPSNEDLSSRGSASASIPHVPELKTVVYRFTPERRSIRPSSWEDVTEPGLGEEFFTQVPVPGPGLTRWEIGLETPLERLVASQVLDQGSINEANGETPTRDAAFNANFEGLLANTTAAAPLTWLPEVRWMAFRYFDGQTWSDHWNSLRCGSLPVAVEVQIRFHEPTEDGKRRPPRENAEGVEEGTEDLSEETADEEDRTAPALDGEGVLAASRQSVCRFLVRLPSAQERPEIVVANTSFPAYGVPAEEDSAAVPPGVPLGDQSRRMEPATDRLSSQELQEGRMVERPDATLPDQWLRTVP